MPDVLQTRQPAQPRPCLAASLLRLWRCCTLAAGWATAWPALFSQVLTAAARGLPLSPPWRCLW